MRREFHQTDKWLKGAKLGQQRIKDGKLKFENDGERREYERAVRANPNNAMGLPAFFPPPLLWATGVGDGQRTELLPCGHQWVRMRVTPKGETTYECKYGHEASCHLDGRK